MQLRAPPGAVYSVLLKTQYYRAFGRPREAVMSISHDPTKVSRPVFSRDAELNAQFGSQIQTGLRQRELVVLLQQPVQPAICKRQARD
jgi:hypothetical protein